MSNMSTLIKLKLNQQTLDNIRDFYVKNHKTSVPSLKKMAQYYYSEFNSCKIQVVSFSHRPGSSTADIEYRKEVV